MFVAYYYINAIVIFIHEEGVMEFLEKLKEKGMQVYVVPEAELPAWQSATKPVWDIFVKHTGDLGKELIEICSKQ